MTDSSAETPLPPQASRAALLILALRAAIRDGGLLAGARLPTEHALAKRYGVSRGVVREAVASLRAEGLLVTRQGSGAFVAQNAGTPPFMITADAMQPIQDVLDVMQLRLAVEVEAAGLAARHRSGAALERLEAAQARFDLTVQAGEIAVDADYEFHLAIAEATGNPYFGRFARFLGTVLIPRQTVQQEVEQLDGRPLYLERIRAEHGAIVQAIRAGDALAAREAVRRHLEAGRNRYARMGTPPPPA